MNRSHLRQQNTGAELSISEGHLFPLGNDLHYRFIELENSTFLLSIHVPILSDGDMCVLFWLGENAQIVLTTNVVK